MALGCSNVAAPLHCAPALLAVETEEKNEPLLGQKAAGASARFTAARSDRLVARCVVTAVRPELESRINKAGRLK